MKRDPDPRVFLPGQAEIRRACARIQATWSERETLVRARGIEDDGNRNRFSRLGEVGPTWEVPVVAEKELAEA